MLCTNVILLVFAFNVLEINSSVVPVVPPVRYTLLAPQNVRPFAAQVSTFTRGLNVLEAPLAAGVLNPPAIFARNVAFPPFAHGPAVLPAPVLTGPVTAPVALPGPPAVLPSPGFLPAPVAASHTVVPAPPAVLPAPEFLPGPVAGPIAPALAEPYFYPHLHAAAVGVIPPPAHVLPVPNARSVHAVAPAVEPVLW